MPESSYQNLPTLPLVGIALRVLSSILVKRKRSFKKDATWAMNQLAPLQVLGKENIPGSGPCLVTINHYSRPGSQGFWLAMGASAVVPVEITWIMTAAWSYTGQKRGIIMKPLVRWFIGRIVSVYGCLRLPSVPPEPGQEQERAMAVRNIIQYVRKTACPVIGLAPEGGDVPGGKLGWPPLGAGRFMLHLNQMGLPVLPVGITEQNSAFCFRFGAPYQLSIPNGHSAQEQDQMAIRQVMGAIAGLLPPSMWGDFSPQDAQDLMISKLNLADVRAN
jgi:hypothetical protein